MAMTALYLDKLNAHMEKMLLERMPEAEVVRFLTPTIGKKGELKDADVLIDTTFQVTKEIIDSCSNPMPSGWRWKPPNAVPMSRR